MQFIDLAAQQERIRPEVDAALARVLDHGRYIMGPEVAELEGALAEFVGAGEVVSCASGTDALVMALLVRGAGPGRAVFVPSFTFAATAEAVALLGATPVFVDIDPVTYNLDPASLDAAVRGLPDGLTAAGVIPVDLFGLPADYAALGAVAEQHGLWVVADAAQGVWAAVDGVRVGSFAPLTTTSFFPAKPLGCYGDGGAVVALDPDDAAVLRSVRVHGSGSDKYDNVRLGINGRLDTLQAAVLLQKLAIFADELDRRDLVARRYTDGLADLATTPVVPDGVRSAWAQYTIRVPERDGVAKALADAGVPTAVYYPLPLHRQQAYAGYPVGAGGMAESDRAADEVLSLPMHPYLDGDDQGVVIDVLRSCLGEAGRP
ncbi:MAG: DegT/DnrJ/EryC1/StrS family aminotransferase [Actinobacteria bacterium]|nr:DegT/DnrJ/EryC1/StrS family aminotransferase [Actinomycetota bacterium]